MAYGTIDIGAGATNRASFCNIVGYTEIDIDNPANASGILNSFEMWFETSNTGGLKVGTFSGSGTSYTIRDYESITSCASGSKKTFTGKNCDVITGDFNGIVATTNGRIEYATSGGLGCYYYSGDGFSGTHTYTLAADDIMSLYATGVTVPDVPTSVSATDNLTDKVTITWTAGTGETGGHRVYRDGADISGVVAHGTATYDDTTAVAGTTYSYTVKAINAAGLSAASTADNGIKLLPTITIWQSECVGALGHLT